MTITEAEEDVRLVEGVLEALVILPADEDGKTETIYKVEDRELERTKNHELEQQLKVWLLLYEMKINLQKFNENNNVSFSDLKFDLITAFNKANKPFDIAFGFFINGVLLKLNWMTLLKSNHLKISMIR